jgi:acetyl-CoA carboxylase carboxyl transferase alpha subunit/acetyl-CoA carboxylase carboxyl transferase beta subunit
VTKRYTGHASEQKGRLMKNLAEFVAFLRERHPGEPLAHEGATDRCVACGAMLDGSELYDRYRVCPNCHFHYTIAARERIRLLVDTGSFRETQRALISIDPISFSGQVSYRRRIFEEQRRTGLSDAIVTGTATIRGRRLVLAVIDFRFLGGSIGCVVGEKLTLAFELGARKKLPVLVVVASGGTRMQEGLLSLAQVAKTAAAAERLAGARVPLITLLANPTIGAAYAGFVSLSDVILAEPGAIVGYGTTRAVEAASGGHLPPGAHTAESHLAHGLLDQIVDRVHQRDFLSALLDLMGARYRLTSTGSQPHPGGAAPPVAAWNTVQLARHEQRPTALDYIGRMTANFIELHGDRMHGDDRTIVCGLGQLGGETVVILGQERNGSDRQHGAIGPEGFRKARRAMQLAAKLRLPLITLIDTHGAAADLRAEEHGLGNAIAGCMATASMLPVPVIAAVIGEGGSEAGIAFGVANRLLMMENAIFSPVSPESAATILYRDPTRVESAATALRLTAADCLKLGVVDAIVPEPVGGAHRDHDEAARELKVAIVRELIQVQGESPADLVKHRYAKLRGLGQYSNYLGETVAHEFGEIGGAVGRRAASIVSRLRRQREAAQTSDEGMLVP